jgi:hypothetical protein
MIRLAKNIDDLSSAVEVVQQFLLETSYNQGQQASKNVAHIGGLVHSIFQQGHIWLAYHDDEPVGILAAIIEPNMWIPEIRQMREIVWFIRSEYRSTTLGGKLWLKYQEKAEMLLKSGQISGYFTTKMTTTDPINLERRGFRLTEMTYLKE